MIWKDSYVLFGRFDVLDVFEAPNETEAQKVAMIIRRYAKSNTETMQAVPWKESWPTCKAFATSVPETEVLSGSSYWFRPPRALRMFPGRVPTRSLKQ